ncbi:MAG: hypothetical protein WCF90_03925 [Methanomicrobiales archaeon]
MLGLYGSSQQLPVMSKPECLLLRSLNLYNEHGCKTRFQWLKDPLIHDCEGNYFEKPDYFTYPQPELAEL